MHSLPNATNFMGQYKWSVYRFSKLGEVAWKVDYSGGNILAQKWKHTKNTGLNIIMIKTCFMQQLWKDSEWEWMNE